MLNIALWHVNNEYSKRLSQAQTFLSLLEQLLLNWDGNSALTVRHALEEISALMEEHHHWRYRFYYQSRETKRMVQNENDVYQALISFQRMWSQHRKRLQLVSALFNDLERPDPHVTRIFRGDDLWEHALDAIDQLNDFQNYFQQLKVS